MPDREKVINYAEETLSNVLPDEKDTSGIMVKVGWIREVLALLKEQPEDINELQKERDELSEELNTAVELIHKKNERIEKLLKEQEAKNVINMTLSKDCFLIASCPKCNALLTRVEHKNYCGYCGQAVKWE